MTIEQECRDAEEARSERRHEVYSGLTCPYCGSRDGTYCDGEPCGHCSKGRALLREHDNG